MRFPSLPPSGKLRLGNRRSSSAVALDIGPDVVVVVQSSGGERGRLRRAIVHPLPVGLVADGEVVNADDLASELRALFEEHKLPRDVRVGLAHPRLMVRMVELPGNLAGQDLDGAVRNLAVDLLPVPLDQLVLDYRCVGHSGDQQRVLMAAARVDGIQRLTDALDKAALRCQRIQLSGLALLAALDHPKLEGEAILYVSAGALTNVVISEDDEPLLVRAASAGSESIANGLAERVGISHEAARAHVCALGVGSSPHHGSPPSIDEEVEAAARLQVREGLRRIVAEVQSSRGVYSGRKDARPIGAVVLTGAMTTWPGVADALRDELDLPVLAAGRDSWPDLGGVRLAPERLDVAVGLALAADDEHPDLRPGRATLQSRALPPRVAQISCAMTAILAAAVVYLVAVSNQASTSRERLGQIASELTTAEQQAAALKPYADFAGATLTRRDAVAKVSESHFNWDRALGELAGVAPGRVWLTSVRGTLSPSTEVGAGGGGAGTSTLRSANASPALELTGCASREGDVPAYMDRLHAITGVTEVGFGRSERLEKTQTSKTGDGTAQAGGDCRGSDLQAARFDIVSYFKPSTAVAAAVQPAGAPAAAAPGAQPSESAPATTAPAQTPSTTTGTP